MNIAFIFPGPIAPFRGGIQRVTDIITKGLQSKGHNIIYIGYRQIPLGEKEKVIAATQIYVNINDKSSLKYQLKKITDEYKIDIAICQLYNKETAQIVSSLDPAIKIITSYHTQPFMADNVKRAQLLGIRPKNKLHLIFKWSSIFLPIIYKIYFNQSEKKTLLDIFIKSDKIVFISDKFYKRIIKHIHNAPISKFVAINNPCSYQAIDSVPQKDNIIIWVGRIDNAGKNTIDFIKIWASISKTNKTWRAIIIGDGPDLQYNKNYVRKKKIQRIAFVGAVANPSLYFRKAQFIISTSWSESWGMILTEGMAFGCIPFAYKTYETVSDIIDDGINGFIVKPRIKDIVKKIQSIINNKELKHNISTAAISKVKSFDTNSIINQWDKLVTSLKYDRD